MTEIKMNLENLLKSRGMTQRQLAYRANIRPATINEYYNNVWKSVKRKHLEAFCEIFKCDVQDIVTKNVIEKIFGKDECN